MKSLLWKRKNGATAKPFKNYYKDWFSTLATALLPQLRGSLSSASVSPAVLSNHVDAIHHHIKNYYEMMDIAAVDDVGQCLYPEWHTLLQKPFLWLGDLHPYLFINLLRSFLEDRRPENDGDVLDAIREIREFPGFRDEQWRLAVAWRSPSRALMERLDQVQCGLRLMVPALAARAREAQFRFARCVGAEQGIRNNKKEMKAAVEEALAAAMEELVGVVVDANRLRRSVLADILSVTSVYQSALFLEALAEFLVGFRDNGLLKQLEREKLNPSINDQHGRI